MSRSERGDGGEDVVLLAGGEGEEEERDGGPEAEEEAGASSGVRVAAVLVGLMRDCNHFRCLRSGEAAMAARHSTVARALKRKADQGMIQMRSRPQKRAEGDGVVVAGDAEVEIAEEVLVDEVEPEPAVDVAVGG